MLLQDRAPNTIFPIPLFYRQRQGDRIGRIFAHWAIVFFGQFFVNYIISPHFCSTGANPTTQPIALLVFLIKKYFSLT
jgi:hypothetical protein